MGVLPKCYFTPDEYLELEVKAEYKSQYVAGEIYAAAGTHPVHNDIAVSLVALLHTQFRGRPCKTYFADVRLRAQAGDLCSYPDVMTLCGEPKFDTRFNPPSLHNPQVIFEVLSPSTEAFDRGDKFARYRLLESLTDYVLVSSEQMRVEHFVRQPDGSWTFREYHDPGHALPLTSVDCTLPLGEIYERVTFPEPPGGDR